MKIAAKTRMTHYAMFMEKCNAVNGDPAAASCDVSLSPAGWKQ